MINIPFIIWYLMISAAVGYRSYSHARCGEFEAVVSGLFWPIWFVGMIFRTGEESVGFRWTEEPGADKDAEASEPLITFASQDQTMTAQDKSRFLVDLSKLDLKYGDAKDIYDLLADRVKAAREV